MMSSFDLDVPYYVKNLEHSRVLERRSCTIMKPRSNGRRKIFRNIFGSACGDRPLEQTLRGPKSHRPGAHIENLPERLMNGQDGGLRTIRRLMKKRA